MESDNTLSLPKALQEQESRSSRQSIEDEVTGLYESLRASLLAYVYHLVGSTLDAEDIVQVAFLQLFDHLNNRAGIANRRGWLFRAVHSLAINHVTRLARKESLTRERFPDHDAGPQAQTAEQQLITRQRVERALAMLAEKERYCLMLRAEGLSYQEIADVLGTSPKSVGVYLSRGLKKFESQNEHE